MSQVRVDLNISLDGYTVTTEVAPIHVTFAR